jgi:hypothetical protein
MTTRPRWLWLAVSTVVCGCGLLSHEPAGQSMRDPIVGFVDRLSIDVCVAGTQLVAPSVAKAGALSICIDKGLQAASCSSNSSCASGERCVCGRCVTRPCRGSAECEEHEVCQGSRCTRQCAADRDCANGQGCTGGGCATRCASASDCAYGEKCSALDGTCMAKICSDTVACSESDDCVAQQVLGEIAEPHVLDWRDARIAFVEIDNRQGSSVSCAIYRAKVVDSNRWEIDPVDPVLPAQAGDDGCVGAPSVLVAGNALVMYGSRGDGAAIFRARSTDGVAFTRDPGDVIVPRLDWENGWVGSPGAAVYRGATVLLYSADRGNAMGVATIDPQDNVALASRLDPQTFNDPVFWRSTDRMGGPFPIVRGESLLVYMTVRGVEGSDAISQSAGTYPADRNDSIGLVETRDMVHFNRFPTGPVFARRTNLRTYLGEKQPSVLVQDTGSWLVYVGSDATGSAVTGLALASTAP